MLFLQVARIANRCLVDHAPSPQTCASLGGVWDDTAAATDKGTGGTCLTAGRAAKRLEELGTAAELLEIHVSHDTTSESTIQLRCFRTISVKRKLEAAIWHPRRTSLLPTHM